MNDGRKEIKKEQRFKSRRSKWKAGMSWASLIIVVIVIIVLPFVSVEGIRIGDRFAVTIGYYFFASLLLTIVIIAFIFSRGYIE